MSLQLERLLGLPGIYFSPVHFTATYLSATTLTLAGAGMPTITDRSQILGVIELRATEARYKYYPSRDLMISEAAGTLTATGAAFAATSIFIVLIAGPVQGFNTVQEAMEVMLAVGLDPTSSSVKNYNQVGSGVVSFTRDLTVINTAYPCAASSTPIWCAFIFARTANVGTAIWGDSTITTIGAPVPKIATMAMPPIYINDLAKLYVAGSNAGDDVDGVALTRAHVS